ncbi:FxSxx-COOH system tetratricopeptide repeat protein [Actinoplanes oblitus]|uniref:FxSxx-COOH system tetratricopeptide repeat protein n=1 Tax=Actinoplanes oblitus TaxID=3040509 RepID=A0ABY8WM08_9ACTN|nr:FxSxx-COOH system tetratricopeptide repeat protein [Actinoplanes oblitus]WIM97895.1 FxSxx-COOH system tetratricopeptide repeat protein [Actinoplanes oblitus]
MTSPTGADDQRPQRWPRPTALHWSDIADALWLASRDGFEGAQRPAPPAPDETVPPVGTTGPGPGAEQPDGTPPAAGPPPAESPSVDGTEAVAPPGPRQPAPREPRAAVPIAQRRTDFFASLRHDVPSSTEMILDEEATAERGMIDRRWLPMLRQATERRWNVVLLVDTGPSMWIWAGHATAISALLERQGVFRDVRVRTLGSDGHGGVEIGSGAGRVTTTPGGIVDPTGRTVVLVFTDGYSDLWWTGVAQSAVALWAAHMVVAVLNPLPQQRWSQTALDPRRTWLRTTGPTPTALTTWTRSAIDTVGTASTRLVDPIAVPVLEIDSGWVRRWADLVAGIGPGVVALPAILVSASHPRATAAADDRLGEPAEYAVARFRAMASPTAVRLAVALAAAPLNVRTMLAVQRRLPRAGPAELAEVLTSGLIRPVVPDGEVTDPVRVTFDFAEGVRKRLLELGHRDRTLDVLRTVEAELGDEVAAVRGLSRRIAAPAAADHPALTEGSRPFLRVELAVNEALSGPHLDAANQLKGLLAERPAVREEGSRLGTMVPPGDVSEIPAARLDELLGPERRRGADFGIGIDAEPVSTRESRQVATISNIPPRNVNFTGRTELLAVLHTRLGSGTTAVLPEAIHGFGGVGKSQLAIEYVHLYQHDYDIVWWIPAERPAQIRTALVELAQRLELPVPPLAGSAVPAVIDALSRGRPSASWLLVFDNAELPEDVQPFFPSSESGKIMVTSRNPEWVEVASPIQVDVFSRAESVQLLRRRAPTLAESDAARLAEALSDLPLAVELAAAWMAETGMATDEYLRLLDAGRPSLTEAVGGTPTAAPPLDYPEEVAAAWSMSLIGLREREPAALRLLQVCAFFAPEPISRILLSNARGLGIHPDLDPVLRNATRFNQAVRTIGRYSLARVDYRTNSLHMHRLVQRVLIAQMEPDERELLRHSAHLLLAANDPNLPEETDHWPRYAELYPHVLASDATECRHGYVRDLVLNEARYLSRWGDFRGARDLAMHAYEVLVRIEGPAHLDALRMANWLGYMQFSVGDYRAAAKLNADTLQLYREALGDDREETLNAIGAVAADLRVAGDFSGALDRSLTVYERARAGFGEGEPFTLRAAHNLAVSLRLSGMFSRALQLGERTHLQLIQVLGADHLDTLQTRGGINLDRRELGEHVTARTDQETLVALLRSLLPDERHALLLSQTQQLAVTRRKAGDLSNALTLSQGVLIRYQERYGEGYPDTTLARLTVSIDQRVLGNLSAAREAGELAADQLRDLLGPDHPHTASAEMNLAVTMRLQGEIEAVRQLDERALRRLTARLGPEHPVVLHARINVVSDYHAVGEARLALDEGVIVLRQCRDLLGANHPTTLACAVNVAMDLKRVGRGDDGERLLADTLTRFGAVLGASHPATVSAAAGLRANCDIDPLPL